MRISEEKQNALAHQRLLELLDYDLLSGLFTWKVYRAPRARAGTTAGNIDHTGYIHVTIDGGKYLAHRLAVFHVTGEWPETEVDHGDLNRSNNRWKNIRPATPGQNRHHTSIRSSNTSGTTGVWWYVRKGREGRWRARIRIDGRRIDLGAFKEKNDAIAAYRAAAIEYYGNFAAAA